MDDLGTPSGKDYENPKDIHIEKGSLRKVQWDRGLISCDDASGLFTAGTGSLSIRLSLPYGVRGGVYEPLSGGQFRTLTDLVIWGANFGDMYITQPGLYAAFTPDGIEFTVWTSAGKVSILDTSTTCEAFKDLVLEFIWDGLQGGPYGSTMALYANGTLTAIGYAPLANERFGRLYTVDGKAVNANFCAMDSPSRKNSLIGTIRRLETYRKIGFLPSGATGRAVRTVSLARAPVSVVGESTLDFSFVGSEGSQIDLSEPEFDIVVPKEVNLHAVGPVGSSRHIYGRDAGVVRKPQEIPVAPEDLPLGFDEMDVL